MTIKHLMLMISMLFMFTITHAQLNYEVSWLGNTFWGYGQNGRGEWMPMFINEIEVSADGKVLVSGHSEAGNEVGVWNPNGRIEDLNVPKQNNGGGNNGCWGWGTDNRAVTFNDTHIFVATKCNDLQRYHRAPPYNYVNAWSTSGIIDGLLVKDNVLYLAYRDGKVEHRNKDNFNLIHSYNVGSPARDIAVDNSGNLWIIAGQTIRNHDSSGSFLNVTITNAGVPTSVSIDNVGRLVVSDDGPRKQILFYDISATPVIDKTFGEEGGIYSGVRGKMGPYRFFNLVGAATDAAGNLYVACSRQEAVLRKFNANGEFEWENMCTGYLDNTNVDHTSDGLLIYGCDEIYEMDYSKSNGQEWTLKALTYDPDLYPNDKRNKGGPFSSNFVMKEYPVFGWIRTLNGAKVQFMQGQYAGDIDIHIFKNDYISHRVSTISSHNRWANYVDIRGNIWVTNGPSIIMHQFTGLDGNGVPQYTMNAATYAKPPQFNSDIQRVRFLTQEQSGIPGGVMYVGGYTSAQPQGGHWGLVGSVVCRFDGWENGNTTNAKWQIDVPKDDEGFHAKEMDAAGDYFFTVPTRARSSYRLAVSVFNAHTGEYLGDMRPPNPYPTDMLGWTDAPNAVTAFKRSNGEYIILVQEDGRGKNIMYRFCPSGDCAESDIKIELLSPDSNSYFLEGDEVTMLATVETDTTSIAEVKFFAGEQLLTALTEQPYEYKTTGLPLGNHQIKAVAYSTEGAFKMSKPVSITVGDGLPKVTLLSPMATAYYTILDNLLFKAVAVDYNGLIDSVAFFLNEERISTITSAPFEFSRVIDEDGVYEIYCIAYDNDQNAVTSDTLTITIHGFIEAQNPGPLSPGLKYKYYEQMGLEKVEDYREENLKDMGIISNFNINIPFRRRNDDFVFIYEGYINIPEDDKYTFYTNSDDGSLLWIDTLLVVDNDGLHGTQERSGNLLLQQGLHPIKVGFFERGGGEVLEVRWSSSSITKGFIPDSLLFRELATGTHTPVVELHSNAVNDSILRTNVLNITATVTDTDNDVFRVEFYRESALSKIMLAGPYTIDFNNLKLGPHTFYAKAYDWSENISSSEIIKVTVYEVDYTNISSIADDHILLYPNPVDNGILNLKGLKPNDIIEVYSLTGSKIMETTSHAEELKIQLQNNKGVLFILVKSGQNQKFYKIIVQ